MPSIVMNNVYEVTLKKGSFSKTAEDGDGNVGKTIRLITQDKKRTWIWEIKLTFVPSCCQMRLQLLHFHAVFKPWPTFQELERRWFRYSGVNRTSAKIETYRVTKVKIFLIKYEDYEEIFFLPLDVGVAVLVCLKSHRIERRSQNVAFTLVPEW